MAEQAGHGRSGNRRRAAGTGRSGRPRPDRSGGATAPRGARFTSSTSSADPAGSGATASRAEARRRPRDGDPPLPDDVTGRELDRDVLRELASLPPETAPLVARHLVMAGRLLDEDDELAYAHAGAARRRAPRLAATREALGLAAYRTGRFGEALAELRAARRISGSPAHLPVLADCERGLGRPERALALADDPAVRSLDKAGQVEMRIVAAGARRDLGQLDAAVVLLQRPELTAPPGPAWVARLRYAYADALAAAERSEEAATWFGRAAEADPEGLTDAAERAADTDFADTDDVVFIDVLEESIRSRDDG